MESISEFELLPPENGDCSLTSRLMFDGKLLRCGLAGLYLDAQYRCSQGFLLLSNEDTPYEESLHITLLSPDCDVIDTLEMSHSYASGTVGSLKVVGENSLEFSFFGDDNWRLTILENPQRWSVNQLTSGVRHRWQRLLWKGYLNLRRLNSK